MSVQIRNDSQRGCGWRKPGGLYLVSKGIGAGCDVIPLELTVCPTCHGGIKPARGFTWIDTAGLMEHGKIQECRDSWCPLGGRKGKHGLIWIGGVYYKKPEDWLKEAASQGVSRRISAVPKDFKLGETWVLVAHREAIVKAPGIQGIDGVEDVEPVYAAGIFHAFQPSAIEYVVKGDETEDELAKLEKRGITPVQVVRVGEQTELELNGDETVTDETVTDETITGVDA